MALVSSVHSFIDPVRYFKPNDPYYWEVDNIPLKQLQENALWLRDQVLGLAQTDGVDRSEFNELRPYAEGGNNVIKVKPGRFIGRINDAYKLTPIQKLSMITGSSFATFESFNNANGTALAAEFLSKIQSTLAAQALGLNGLIERVLTWPALNNDLVLSGTIVNGLPNQSNQLNSTIKWPLVENASFYQTIIQSYGAAWELQRLSNEFIKQFRGVARTAVVDIPSELSISIPAFDANDFFYWNGGNKVPISGAQVRIDLLFVYSKPVDVSSTTLQKWSGGLPTTITTPVLGLVKGAGVGIRLENGSLQSTLTPALGNSGETLILPHVADQNQATNGFQGLNIHGSFPSPDDLMNLAPLISESLAYDDPQLIGQSILPIAYIVVRSTADVNTVGNTVLTDNDIVDIRPFFRTAELTYNERAGLAAAIPSPSLANPVVTQYSLDRESVRLKEYIDQVIGTEVVTPRVVAGGVIWGGLSYGPEGAINDVLTRNGITENLFSDQIVPTLPDWDVADWWEFFPPDNQENKGSLRTDRINYYQKYNGGSLDGGNGVPGGLLAVYDSGGNQQADYNLARTKRFIVAWVKKKILIDKSATPWLADYDVRATLQNCLPVVANATASEGDNSSAATASHIFIEKRDDYFIIYVGYSVSDRIPQPNFDRTSSNFNNWIAKSDLFPYPTIDNTFFGKASRLGACTYPTVSFEVIGYPQNWYQKTLAQFPNTPLLALR